MNYVLIGSKLKTKMKHCILKVILKDIEFTQKWSSFLTNKKSKKKNISDLIFSKKRNTGLFQICLFIIIIFFCGKKRERRPNFKDNFRTWDIF